MNESGLDIILDPNEELERCLSAALPKHELKKLANFAPVDDKHDRQKVRELCAMWDLDRLLQGMSQVKCCCPPWQLTLRVTLLQSTYRHSHAGLHANGLQQRCCTHRCRS